MTARALMLSVDFDFFVPEEIDWDFGHQESSLFIEGLWQIRLTHGFCADKDYTLEQNIGKCAPHPAGFWDTLHDLGYRITPSTPLVVADSHAHGFEALARHRGPADQILHFDAHADIGYGTESMSSTRKMLNESKVECGSWLLAYGMTFRPRLKIVYPQWKGLKEWESEYNSGKDDWRVKCFRSCEAMVYDENKLRLTEPIDLAAIFICRSGAWVPPWVDPAFTDFVKNCPVSKRRRTIHKKPVDPMKHRFYDYEQAKKEGTSLKEQMREMNEQNHPERAKTYSNI